MKKNFVEELRWRGMLHDIMPGTEELLNKEMCKAYIGFDPTADSYGIGNLVQIMTLLHFQQAGHQPIALIGGATGMVGDPSGKSEERNLLDEHTLLHNINCQKLQMEKLLNFEAKENPAIMVNNYDWFKEYNFLEFIRDVGKHITINYMLAKDSVKSRLETGMSFTEFSYQLVQGYDFYYLWKNQGVKIQLGGSDQWGNIVTGTELIRRKEGGDAYAITTQLIKKADGSKFGKTESGNIWLDPKQTSPYKFYQFWLNSSDEDAAKYIRIFTLKDREEIEAIEKEHNEAPHQRLLQKKLAEDITKRVHSEEALKGAIDASSILFGKTTSQALANISEDDFLSVFEGVPQFDLAKADLESGVQFIELLTANTSVFPSKGEARKMIQAGGVSLNKEKVIDPASTINADHLINKNYLLIQKGKKNYFLINVK